MTWTGAWEGAEIGGSDLVLVWSGAGAGAVAESGVGATEAPGGGRARFAANGMAASVRACAHDSYFRIWKGHVLSKFLAIRH